jgi:hypothetical protein
MYNREGEAFVVGIVFAVFAIIILNLWLPSTEVTLCREAGYITAERIQGEWYCVEGASEGEGGGIKFYKLVDLIEPAP